ncbi:nuclear transport factor 2 family protein [Maribacter sp. 2210JD10-5]|uniref:nuclear transport factor 2 family protein n=1 Tax=Maribacter sp. 2210JD10-5 TaxID=3386272 RepID=UPI0039BCFCDE
MRMLHTICLLIFINITSAQTAEQSKIQKTIETFFDAFHAQDAEAMKDIVDKDVILQTIGKNREGKQNIRTENFEDLIKSITSIPDSVAFQERILDYSIQVDGAMANAWTPYEFWLNETFHHCGVNSFQLFKEENDWKIIYLIDTRRREGCEPKTE